MTVVPRAVFWINPPTYKYSPKLVEFISLNPYTYVLVMELNINVGYVDGL